MTLGKAVALDRRVRKMHWSPAKYIVFSTTSHRGNTMIKWGDKTRFPLEYLSTLLDDSTIWEPVSEFEKRVTQAEERQSKLQVGVYVTHSSCNVRCVVAARSDDMVVLREAPLEEDAGEDICDGCHQSAMSHSILMLDQTSPESGD